MKTRRIWIVIAVILVGGISSTIYTKQYVSERGMDASMRTLAEASYDAGEPETAAGDPVAAVPYATAAVPFGAKAKVQSGMPEGGADGKEASIEAAAGHTVEESRSEATAAEAAEAVLETAMADAPSDDSPPLVGSDADAAAVPPGGAARAGQSPGNASAPVPAPQAAPADAAPQSADSTGTASPELSEESHASVIVAGGGKDNVAVSYQSRLEDLDAQIERSRSSDSEKVVGNSVKARSENELKLWEAELDGILKALEEQLDSEQVESLYAKQREWQREKESKALDASKKQSGSSLAEVEYTISLAESTRARAYELVEEFGAVLGE